MVIAKYIRLSVEDGKSDSQSIENQRTLLDAHIVTMEEPNVTVLEFVDNGYSGTNFNRPGIQKLLALVQERQVDVILVKDFSRIGRNALETGYYLERVFPICGVRVVSLADGYDSKDYGEDTGGLLVSFKFLMAEYYSKDLSQKITSAARERMRRGERISKRCVFGYRKEGDNLVPDEATVPTVERIFQLAIQGHGVSKIAAVLTQEGCPTPEEQRGERTSAYPCIWSHGVVRQILIDERYMGTYVAGKTQVETLGGRRVPVPESQWIRIPDHHPAIITAEKFARVQERFKPKPKAKTKVQPKMTDSAPGLPMEGLVYCGHCGYKMQLSRGKILSYQCKHTRNAPHALCHKASVLVQDVEKQAFKALKVQAKRLFVPDDTMETHEIIGTKADFYEAMLEGRIDENTYKNEIKSLEEQKKVQKRHSTPNLVQSALEAEELSQTLVKACFEKIIFKQNSELFIQWKPDFSSKTG